LGDDLALRFVDLSETGIRLLLRTELAAGQEVEVGILAQGQGKPVRRLANVVWCAAAEGGYVVGLRFQRALGYAEYQQLT
jgi:PilZ domain-containing protein